MNPKISVIVPVYNAEKFVGKCIESVQAQTYIDWQMIIVDDGSRDMSLDVCQRYADTDKRICVIHQDNAGAGAARNTGLTKAAGYYIVFIDSDDYVDKDYFSLLANHSEDVVFVDVQAVGEDGKVVRNEFLSDYRNLSKDDFMRSQMTGKINWGGVRKVVKREILEKNKIRYTNHKVGEEALFTYLSVFYSKTISFIDKPVYFYIQRNNSLSQTKMDDPWGDVALALKEQTKSNGSYSEYADTVNAFILTAAAVSSDRLASNYSKKEYLQKVSELHTRLMQNLDTSYPIDYKHMSSKATFLGMLLLAKHFMIIRLISNLKHKLGK